MTRTIFSPGDAVVFSDTPRLPDQRVAWWVRLTMWAQECNGGFLRIKKPHYHYGWVYSMENRMLEGLWYGPEHLVLKEKV